MNRILDVMVYGLFISIIKMKGYQGHFKILEETLFLHLLLKHSNYSSLLLSRDKVWGGFVETRTCCSLMHDCFTVRCGSML